MGGRRGEWEEGEGNGRKERGMGGRRGEWEEGEGNGRKERGMGGRRGEWEEGEGNGEITAYLRQDTMVSYEAGFVLSKRIILPS